MPEDEGIISHERGKEEIRTDRRNAWAMLIKNLAYEWLRTKSVSIKVTSYDNYQWVIDKVIVPRIGTMDAGTFAHKDLQDFANNVSRKYGQSILSASVRAVKVIHKYGCKVGYIGPIVYDIEMPHAKDWRARKTDKSLPKRQADKLMSLLIQIVDDPSFYPVAGHPKDPLTLEKDRRNALGSMLGLGCGMRISEVCGCIPARDIDYDGETITVERIAVYQSTKEYRQNADGRKKRRKDVRLEVGIEPPKTEASERDIPLPDGFAALFDKYAPKEGFLISGKAGNRLPLKWSLSEWFRNLMRARPDLRYITFHGLRHTYATLLLDGGADAKAVSELLGHTKVETTLGIYAHPDEDAKRSAVGKHQWKGMRNDEV